MGVASPALFWADRWPTKKKGDGLRVGCNTGIAFLRRIEEYAIPLIVLRMPLSIQLTMRRTRIAAPLAVNCDRGAERYGRPATPAARHRRNESCATGPLVTSRRGRAGVETGRVCRDGDVGGQRHSITRNRAPCHRSKPPRGARPIRCRLRPGGSRTASAHPDVKVPGAGGGRSNPAGGGAGTR